jgi:branched-chain amino acid transport system ATP-binding protein
VSRAPLISVQSLVCGYEPGVPIVDGVSMSVERGEVITVLGPNGAGKSTLVKAIAGLVPIAAGRVLCDGEDLENCAVHERVRKGIAYVPQTHNVFATLSVSDNLRISAQLLPAAQRAAAIAGMRDIFPDLSQQWSSAAGRLSGGQRQMLAVARALLVSPKVLLLDEPSAGLAPKAVGELFSKLAEIRHSAVGIVLIEQNVKAALSMADRAYVLVDGRNRREGAARALAADPQLAALYLDGHLPREDARGAPH